VSLAYPEPFYANGKPLFDDGSQLINSKGWLIASTDGNLMFPNSNYPLATPTGIGTPLGKGLVDQWGNILANNGAVVTYDSGMSALGLSAPPATSSSFGRAGMVTYDANYQYVCIADDTWRRIPLGTF
jgi:hypothetical protein